MVYLENDEAMQLLTEPHPTFDLEYNEEILNRLLILTRNHPYLLQLMGESLVKQANKHHTRRITRELMDAAADSALTSGTAYFHNLWREFTGTTKEEILAGRQILLALAHGKPPQYLDEQSQAALTRLKRYHVIEYKDSNYQFEVPLVEHWVKNRGDI
jgi:hypothetical protein